MQNSVPDAPYIIEMSRDTPPSRPQTIVDEESDEEDNSCD